MKKLFLLICLLAMLVPLTSAMADESSSYITGYWCLSDDCWSKAQILNPGSIPVYVDAAFFDKGGHFVGCDMFVIPPDGTYTIDTEYESEAGKLSFEGYGRGQLKIVASASPCNISRCRLSSVIGDATITGFNTHYKDWEYLMAIPFGMKTVTLNGSTRTEMDKIHNQCREFLAPKGSAQ